MREVAFNIDTPANVAAHPRSDLQGAPERATGGYSMMREVTMPEAPAGFPLAVSREEIPFGVACAAYAWNSMMPEERARREQADYLGAVYAVWERFAPLATTEESRDKLAAHVERYRERYRRWTLILLAARSRVANPMVTGPAKFPTARNQKRLATEDRRREEFLAWRERAISAIHRDMRPPEPSAAEQIAKLTARRDQMKTINAEFRKCRGDIDAMTIPSESMKQAMHKTRASYWCGGPSKYVPFEAFELTSINGKIKRLEASVAREARRAVVVASLGESGTREVMADDVRIVDNIEADRVQVFFPAKPDVAMRDRLKASGFRWAPSAGAWQAYRTSRTLWRLKQLFGVEFNLT